MLTQQEIITNENLEINQIKTQLDNFLFEPKLVLCFGDKSYLNNKDITETICNKFTNAQIVFSSTAGEISNRLVTENSLVITAISFQTSNVVTKQLNIKYQKDSFEAGFNLASEFSIENLKLLMVISDGQLVNGSELVEGLNKVIQDIPITGGLAGDGANFESTLVGLNNLIEEGNIIGIGFYGKDLQIGTGTKGGWDKFGPMRTITKSEKNVLYEIDGENALELYKKYLGNYAEQLPSSALLFPISIFDDKNEVVRTILSIDEEKKSMTFAGNMPVGSKVRLMQSNLDKLAITAADAAIQSDIHNVENKLGILISCVGRKIIFGERIDEEIESSKEVLGENSLICGFYSYGEIAPFDGFMKCELHNQTMTITTISEL